MPLLGSLAIFIAYAVFWGFIFQYRDEVKGYTYEHMITYFVFVKILEGVGNSMAAFKMSDHIHEGMLSNLLIKPLKIKAWLLTEDLGRVIFDGMIRIIIFLGILFFLFGEISFELSGVALFIVFVVLSYLLSFNISFIMACFSFWLDPSSIASMHFALRRIFHFLAGGVVPIVFFPEFSQEILKYLPFKYLINTPIDVLSGRIKGGEIGVALIILVVWIITLEIATHLFFKFSYKANEAVGI